MSISAFYGGLGPITDTTNTPLTQDLVNTITASGFNTVIISLFHIGRTGVGSQITGDIIFNHSDDVVATDGTIQTGYVGQPGSDWAFYLNQLKAGGIEKIYLSFGGGGGVQDYTTIVNDIMAYQNSATDSGPYIPQSSNLYQNFVALKQYFPMVDGIDIDQEENPTQQYADAMTALGKMAIEVGFNEITMVPPFDSFAACYLVSAISINMYAAALPNPVNAITRIGLQIYGECTVANWADVPAAIGISSFTNQNPLMYVGATAAGATPKSPPATTKDVYKIFKGYLPFGTVPIDGGFIWQYTFIESSLLCYEQAMNAGLSGVTSWPPSSGPCSS